MKGPAPLSEGECADRLNRAMAHWDEKHQAAWDSFHQTGSSAAMIQFYDKQVQIALVGVLPS